MVEKKVHELFWVPPSMYGGNVKSKALLIPYFTHQECTEGIRLIDFSALNCNRNSCDMRLFLDHNLQ